ncbi:hypothetical protein [Ascidiimonas aurantiaca]|uniref:hypothetical protein n=1 Tax=Ascidiimonas aurantiaca TaxID=1685432 RepID=UPI0030ECD242
MPAKPAKEKALLLKENQLSNNCPVCFSNSDLILYFHQKVVRNRFFTKVTGKITPTLRCKKCDSTIYPVNWTDDIERVFDYYNKTVVARKTSFRLSVLSLILLLIVITAAALILWFGYEKVSM